MTIGSEEVSGLTPGTGLVERLRETAHAISQYEPEASDSMGALCVEAAATIEEMVGALANAKWLLEGIKRAGWVTKPSFGDEINLGLERTNAAIALARGEQPIPTPKESGR